MSKCRLFIVRHTESVGNIEGRLTGRKDYPLTENGKKYVKLLTEKLKDIKFDAAYSSTSGRAEKTIEPLAILNHLKIHEKEGLCEMYFGIYNGWKWEDVNRINPQIRQTQMEINEIAGIPEQETTEETANRMYQCIQKIAEDWSLYLTDDLKGNLHGFYNINKYLIKDSDIYKNAYKWATGIDITYVSSHVLSNPTFTNERIENFKIYNENAFSCEVYLQKNLKLTNANKRIEDIMHERMYFAYYQTQDNNGEWKLVNMQSITDNQKSKGDI